MIPVAGLVWDKVPARIGVLIAMAATSFVGWKLNVMVAIFIPWFGLVFAFLGQRFPRLVLKGLIGFAIIMIAGAPLLASLAQMVDKESLQSLPMSWIHRLYMWEFLPPQIREHPFIGHGFDSARTFKDQLVLPNGETVSLVSMHTHNAGLQIWLETGLVGALLAIFCLSRLSKPLSHFVLGSPRRAFGLSGFLLAFIITASLSFGVWQFWWWGCLVFGLAVIQLYSEDTENLA